MLLALIALFYPLLAPRPHRIDETHFDLIRVGMTEAEVEAIFGAPAGSYDWAVQQHDGSFVVFALIDWGADQNVGVSINQGGFIAGLSAPRTAQQWTWLADGRQDQPLFKRWISRHGAFSVELDRNGRVGAVGMSGTTRIEPPWQRWWRKIIDK